MKNLVQKLTVTAVAVMPVFLCGCPGASYVDNDPSPKGYIVKMKNDYSDKVMATMFISSVNRDTSFCCASTKNHTIKITNTRSRQETFICFILVRLFPPV